MQLSPAETAIDTPIGEHAAEPALPRIDAALHPTDALQDAIRPALERPPCLVTFSGGRDSSAVLAIATSLARREQLSLPIPATWQFPAFPEAQETRWQESVVRHLGLPDWQRMLFGSELNWLGPVAQRVLSRHGLMSPAGAHTLLTVLEAAGQGTVLTGLEGDGLFNGGSSALPRDVLARRVAPTPRSMLSVARAVSPAPLRRRAYLHRSSDTVPWLRPRPARSLQLAEAADIAGEPLRWNRRVGWWARRRYVVVLRQALAIVAGGTAASIRHPLLDRRFLASLARWGGPWGSGRRTDVLRELFGPLLPAATIERRDKADFTRAWWSGEARDFAASWTGADLPEDLVDAEALHRSWSEPEPDVRSALLLQAAWLAASGPRERQQPVNCRLQ